MQFKKITNKKKERKTEFFFLVNFYFSLINDLPNKKKKKM